MGLLSGLLLILSGVSLIYFRDNIYRGNILLEKQKKDISMLTYSKPIHDITCLYGMYEFDIVPSDNITSDNVLVFNLEIEPK